MKVLEKSKVYVDMDGCVADFQKLAEEIAGCTIDSMVELGTWDEFKEGLCNSSFFYDLEEMPLVNILKKCIGKWEILTAVGNYNTQGVVELKKLWVEKVFGKGIPFNYVVKSKAKAEFACENSFLIDDRVKSVKPFSEAGGSTMLFTGSEFQMKMIEAMLLGE